MKLPAAIAVLACLACADPLCAAPRHSLDSQHFRFYYDTEHLMAVETVRLSAESSYRRISDLLGFDPAKRIPVLLYSDRKEFQRDTGIKRSELVLGVATSADQAIRLDASEIFEAPDRVIGHEVSHIFLNYLLGPYVGDLPLWMNEGLAQVMGGAYPDAAEARVTDAVVSSRLIPLRDLTIGFPEGEAGGLAYAEAQSAAAALLEEGGWAKMRALMDQLKAAKTFDAAMREVYGMSLSDWEGRWRRQALFNARFATWAQIAEWVVPFLMFVALVWGIVTVRRHKIRQIIDEEPPVEITPPSWWKEDEFRR